MERSREQLLLIKERHLFTWLLRIYLGCADLPELLVLFIAALLLPSSAEVQFPPAVPEDHPWPAPGIAAHLLMALVQPP